MFLQTQTNDSTYKNYKIIITGDFNADLERLKNDHDKAFYDFVKVNHLSSLNKNNTFLSTRLRLSFNT
jgi:hypothetical protein